MKRRKNVETRQVLLPFLEGGGLRIPALGSGPVDPGDPSRMALRDGSSEVEAPVEVEVDPSRGAERDG